MKYLTIVFSFLLSLMLMPACLSAADVDPSILDAYHSNIGSLGSDVSASTHFGGNCLPTPPPLPCPPWCSGGDCEECEECPQCPEPECPDCEIPVPATLSDVYVMSNLYASSDKVADGFITLNQRVNGSTSIFNWVDIVAGFQEFTAFTSYNPYNNPNHYFGQTTTMRTDPMGYEYYWVDIKTFGYGTSAKGFGTYHMKGEARYYPLYRNSGHRHPLMIIVEECEGLFCPATEVSIGRHLAY
jgi:hypothetical protein